VIEILLNPDGTIWADYLGEGKRRVATMDSITAAAAIGRVGASFNIEVTTKSPIVECEFPLDGSRFEAVVPPRVSAPVFSRDCISGPPACYFPFCDILLLLIFIGICLIYTL